MTTSEERFHLFGKLILHLLLEEPLRILDMNRAGTKNMFMRNSMRQKLKDLPDEQFELFRDVFIHLVTDGIYDLLRYLVHNKEEGDDVNYRFGDTAETASHYARVAVDGETVTYPSQHEFADIWVRKWQKASGIHPTSQEIAIKYHDQGGAFQPERVSDHKGPPNTPRLAMEKFGKMLIEHCKDGAIKSFEWFLEGRGASGLDRVLAAKTTDIPDVAKDALRDCAISSVISGVHDFLFALQESQDFGEGIEVTVDGIDIVQASDGIHGEIFGEDGFDAKFSKYPTSDDIEEKYRGEIAAIKKKIGRK